MVLHADIGLMVMLLVLLIDLEECGGCLRVEHRPASMLMVVMMMMMVVVVIVTTMKSQDTLVRTGSKLSQSIFVGVRT